MAKRKSIIFIVFLILILICSCTKHEKEIQYIEKPVYVEVPIVQKIEFKPIKKPINYLKTLNNNSSPKEIAEAYVNTVKQQNIYIKQLEQLIEPFYIKEN